MDGRRKKNGIGKNQISLKSGSDAAKRAKAGDLARFAFFPGADYL
jgi:hypothetical protein